MLNNLMTRKSKYKKTRLGRGYGSGHGGHTSTRGMKGQKSRTGGKVRLAFEGGQLPLVKRLPHKKGFNRTNKIVNKIVKLSDLINLDLLNPKTSELRKILKLSKNQQFKILRDVESAIVINSNIKISKN